MPARKSPLHVLLYTSAFATTSATVYYGTSRPKRGQPPPQQLYLPPRDQHGAFVLPTFPHIKTRTEQLADLQRHSSQKTSSSPSSEVYDLLIVGGGATGTGIALDAATRGLKVALIERDDFSSGTSSRSTKLVHGGLRYLEKAVWNLDYEQYELVQEALRERRNFLRVAPHLTSWLPVMIPLQHWWQAPYLWIGTKMYDLLARSGSEANPSSYFMPRRKALAAFPMLKESLVGALVYYDGQQDDSRMNVSLALTAALYGATVVNHVEVTGLQKDGNGRLCGVYLRDLISEDNGTGEQQDLFVRAKGIVNATGPFTDAINSMDSPSSQTNPLISPSSGVHITLPSHFSPSRIGLLSPTTSDGRVLFILPWQNTTLAGTTDNPCTITSDPRATERDIEWILAEVRKYLSPDLSLERQDVLAAWSGIRPLVRNPDARTTESLVRSHLIGVSPSGLLTCAGGKWTTYRQMAEDAVDQAIDVFDLKPRRPESVPHVSGFPEQEGEMLDGTCRTAQLRLLGAHGYSPTLHINLIQRFGLEEDIAVHLARAYGDRAWELAASAESTARSNANAAATVDINRRLAPGYPFIPAEVQYAIRREYARTAIDVLARRTRLGFLDARAALEALPGVLEGMSVELGWDAERIEREWSVTLRFLGTMGLPESMRGLSRDDVLEGRIEGGFLPRKGKARTKVTGAEEIGEVGGAGVEIPRLDGEVVQ